MKKFLPAAALFLLPVLLFFSGLFAVLRSGREYLFSTDPLVTYRGKYLVGYSYNESNIRHLKWKILVEQERFPVWALGSSRVLQFRAEMFEKPFYNAGFTVESVADFLPFLKSLPEDKLPRFLMIGLDQWMFNKNWDNLKNAGNKAELNTSETLIPSKTILRQLVKDLASGKIKPAEIIGQAENDSLLLIGFNARINGKGFRRDGSLFYGNQISFLLDNNPAAADFQYQDTYERIRKGVRRFEFASSLNPEAVKKVRELLEFCHSHKIQVTAFLPPFADAVNRKMQDSGNYTYLSQIYPALLPVFEEYHFRLHDFSSLSTIGSSDKETIDGFHGGELCYLKMLLKMAETDAPLRNCVNTASLSEKVKNPANRYLVYPN